MAWESRRVCLAAKDCPVGYRIGCSALSGRELSPAVIHHGRTVKDSLSARAMAGAGIRLAGARARPSSMHEKTIGERCFGDMRYLLSHYSGTRCQRYDR